MQPLASPVYALAARNPDAVLNTLRYLFFHTRCGVLASIRGGRVVTFVPFANAEYVNHYGHRLKLTTRDLSVSDYVAEKARALKRQPEALLPDTATWWFNGGIMCNVMPQNVWGDEYVAAIRDMLDETCVRHVVPDVDFFINKRDYPQLRADGREPYAEFIGDAPLDREAYSAYVPVFSFYTGTDMADVPMPTTEDWGVATGKCFPPGSIAPSTVAGSDTAPSTSRRLEYRAVFRGAATGRGVTADTNIRLRIAEMGQRRPDLLDAGVTAYNTRDKVVQCAPGCDADIVVDFLTPGAVGPRVPYMSMDEQCARFRYVLYADGHCAASRYGTLMSLAGVILRVESTSPRTCGVLWLFSDLISGVIDGDAVAVPDGADHFLIHADLSNLECTIEYLRKHDEVADRTVASARLRAPTVKSITEYWLGALTAVHLLTATKPTTVCSSVPSDDVHRVWFTPYESKYARLRAARSSSAGSTAGTAAGTAAGTNVFSCIGI